MVIRLLSVLGTALAIAVSVPQSVAAQEGDPAACTFTSSTSPEMDAVLATYGAAIDNFAEFCTRLGEANLGVDVAEYASVQFDSTTAIVTLRLYDLTSGVRSYEASFSFRTMSGEGETVRSEVLSDAYSAALGFLAYDIDTYIASVATEITRLRDLHQTGFVAVQDPPAEECNFTFRGMSEIVDLIDEYGGLPSFEGYEALCEALRARGAGLELGASTMMNEGYSHAWASVGVYDRATGVLGPANSFAFSTTIDAQPGDSVLDLGDALQAALGSLAGEHDAILQKLDEVVAANQTLFGA